MLDDKFFTSQDSSSSSIRCGTALILRQNFIDLEKKYTRKGRDVSERVGKERKTRIKSQRERERNARGKRRKIRKNVASGKKLWSAK